MPTWTEYLSAPAVSLGMVVVNVGDTNKPLRGKSRPVALIDGRSCGLHFFSALLVFISTMVLCDVLFGYINGVNAMDFRKFNNQTDSGLNKQSVRKRFVSRVV